MIEVHHTHCISFANDEAVTKHLTLIEQLVRQGLNQGEKIMATLDQVLDTVTSSSTVVDSVSELVKGLRQQVADALAGTTLPPAVQAKVDAIFSAAETNKAKLAAALLENTPEQP